MVNIFSRNFYFNEKRKNELNNWTTGHALDNKSQKRV